MASRIKVTVSLDHDLVGALGRFSRKTGRPRSRVVEEAVRLWHRQQLEQALKEGYRAMASDDRATARRYWRAARAAWK